MFGTGDQNAAAAAQTAGINAGYGQLANLYGQAGNQITNYGGQATNALQQNYTAGLQPYQKNFSGAQAGTTQLGNVLGLNGPAGNQQALKTLQSTPGYQFQLQQGDNAINAAAAANGTLNSGNQALALSNYNQGLAGTTYNNYVSQLQPYLNSAATAAGGIGSTYAGLGSGLAGVATGVGGSLANLSQGQGNAAYGAQTSIGNANANASLAGLNASGNILNAGMNLGSALLGFA